MAARPPTRNERRQRQHDAVVEDILTIAREMMQADGVAALSFNAIARRLGMKPPSLYTYFPSKDAIYDELFRRGFIEFTRSVDERIDRAAPLPDLLRDALRAYMRFGLENPDLFQLMFQRPVPGFTPSEESMAVSLGRLAESRAILRDALEGSGIDLPTSLDESGDLIIALMYGLTELQLANNPESPVGEGRFGKLIDPAVQLLMDAWGIDVSQQGEEK